MTGSVETFDAIVIGAGAAGLFFAGEAGKRGRRVLAIDHAQIIGEKIRISGGGRCNFTNLNAAPENFISENPKFCISALKGFTPADFLKRIDARNIAWREKKLGQLFCVDSAQQIIDMLLSSCREAGVDLRTGVVVEKVSKEGEHYRVDSESGAFRAPKLVIATGGKSIPKVGATGFGYKIAREFGLNIIEPRPALAPLTFEGDIKKATSTLSGAAVDATVTVNAERNGETRRRKAAPSFRDGLLFTHRGLSGPSILQISSYWREGEALEIDLAPDVDIFAQLRRRRETGGAIAIQNALADILPRRVAQELCALYDWRGNLADWSDEKLKAASNALKRWTITPSGSEGYRTAEVTLGGVDTAGLDSRTMEAKAAPGLYFIGEVVDVTGWLGGYNFQWAWASAYAAAKAI